MWCWYRNYEQILSIEVQDGIEKVVRRLGSSWLQLSAGVCSLK